MYRLERKLITNEVADEIMRLHEDGFSQEEISKKVNLCRTNIGKFIRTGKLPFTKKTYTQDETFFEKINSPEKAYWLGWLASDGSLSEKRSAFSIELNEKDRDILVLLNTLIKSDRQILNYFRKDRGRTYSHLKIYNKKLYADLLNHGLSPNKTKTVFIPDTLPSELFKFYLRGYFEGDGNITKGADGVIVSICGQSEMVFTQMRDMVFQQTGIMANLKQKPTNNNGKESFIFVLRFGGSQSGLGFLSWLYSERVDLCLKRKYDSFLKNLNSYKERRLRCNYPIRQLSLDGRLIKEWPSLAEVRRILKIKKDTISKICKERSKRIYRNSMWEYGDVWSAGFLIKNAY